MPSISSVGSRSCLHGSFVDDAEPCGLGGGISSTVVHVVRRGVTGHEKNIILGSILGILGAVAVLVGMFYLARYFMYREAMAADMPIQAPTEDQQRQSEEKPMYPPPPIQHPVKRTNTPDPGTYMPNHPYALTYGRRDSVGSSHPAAPVPTATAPPAVPTLHVSSVSHPYSSQQSNAEGAPASTIYESFISPESPEPTERAPSPIASTVGGVYAYPPSQYEPVPNTAMSDEAPSSNSQPSSTTPLRGGGNTRNGNSFDNGNGRRK